MKKYQKYWLCGIIGAVCFGIGDWLLGYVDPGIVSESLSVIKSGHGEGYDLIKITITLLLGAIGVPFLMLGSVKMADLVSDDRKKKAFRFWMALLPVGWLIIHFTVSFSICVYAWGVQHGMGEMAEQLAADIQHMLRPAQVVSYLFAGIPLVLLIVYVLRGKTSLKTRSQLFTPVLWMALLAGVKFFLPATPLSNGIDTFCMNAGLIIWFGYLLTVKAEPIPRRQK
ncbi:MAG: hypothetical protein IJ083_14005 [Clostridia bacterium]|nr:hypothetical protein [Clostridia bacterium]